MCNRVCLTRTNDDAVISTGERKLALALWRSFTASLPTPEESPRSVPHFSVINSCQPAMFYLTLNRGAPSLRPLQLVWSHAGRKKRARDLLLPRAAYQPTLFFSSLRRSWWSVIQRKQVNQSRTASVINAPFHTMLSGGQVDEAGDAHKQSFKQALIQSLCSFVSR